MNTHNTIWDAIVAKIQTAIDGGSSTVQVVYKDYKNNFEGIPAICVVPSENEADYNSTGNDRLTFGFKAIIYYLVPEGDATEDAGEAISACLSEVITLFNERNSLSSAGVDFVTPVPGVWAFEARGEGTIYRIAEVSLRCVKFA